MKKLFLFLAAFTLTATSASAQMFAKNDMGKTTFGIRAGVSISSIDGQWENSSDGRFNNKSRTGFNVGAIVDIPITNGFYIQPGLLFTTKGAKENRNNKSEKIDQKYNASYLEMPILASFRFGVSESVQIQANVGPYLALGVGGKYKVDYSSHSGSKDNAYDMPLFGNSTEEDETYGMKRFDLGLSFGAGVTLHQHYYIGIQYDLGLMNLAIKNKENWGDEAKIHTGNLMIQVGYNF